MSTDKNIVRVCQTFLCPVLTYQTKTYPEKINHACPACGKIGKRQS